MKAPEPRSWSPAEQVEPYWVYDRPHRRLRLLVIAMSIIIVGVALVVAGYAALVAKAHGDYISGQQALAAGQYHDAIQQLRAAEVMGRPYADARALLNDAIALSNGQREYVAALNGTLQPTAATLTLRRGAALFQSGRYTTAQALLADLSSRVPPAVTVRLSTSSNAAVAAVLLLVSANQAFKTREWRLAGADAVSVLLRYPRCGPAAWLAAEAARRVRAEPLALRAVALTAAGRWVAGLKVVRQTLRVDPSYPGAAALLARIDATLAHRRAAAAKTATRTSTVAPPTPVAPQPTPQPPPPP